jgi:hypothetical protein
MIESYICGNNLLQIVDENGILTAETFHDFNKTKKPIGEFGIPENDNNS